MPECECVFCKNDRPFDLSDALLKRIAEGNVTIFAGAGISTENPDYSKHTFYNEIRSLLNAAGGTSFPALMDALCARPDGRIDMIQRIKSRFSYFSSFADFYRPMTRFHRAVRPLYMIKDIVTTNWDDFFERETGLEPFVYDEDMAFIDSSPRRLIKIHGSITNVGSIVATTDDYDRSFERLESGPMGAYLKTIMSTKTIIYTGYSLTDANYLRLLANISKMMGRMARQSYFLAPHINKEHLAALPIVLTPIETDGAFFFEVLREHFRKNPHLGVEITSDSAMQACDELLEEVIELHQETSTLFAERRNPALFLALSYQDGLIHALQRIKFQRKTHEYFDFQRVHRLFHGYERKVEEYVAAENYWDAVYCRGYQNGMLFLMMADEDPDAAGPPAVDLLFDDSLDTIAKARRYSRRKVPAGALKQFDQFTPTTGTDLVADHTPYA